MQAAVPLFSRGTAACCRCDLGGFLTSLTPHSRRKRPSVGIIFVIISCLSLQFGAAFAVHLFPLFGPWLVTTLRLILAAITVGAAVWIAGRWRAHRAGAQTAYMAVPAKHPTGS